MNTIDLKDSSMGNAKFHEIDGKIRYIAGKYYSSLRPNVLGKDAHFSLLSKEIDGAITITNFLDIVIRDVEVTR